MQPKVLAGCDSDLKVKLFVIQGDGSPRLLEFDRDWHDIQRDLGASPGEMLLVSFSRDPQEIARPKA